MYLMVGLLYHKHNPLIILVVDSEEVLLSYYNDEIKVSFEMPFLWLSNGIAQVWSVFDRIRIYYNPLNK